MNTYYMYKVNYSVSESYGGKETLSALLIRYILGKRQ